MKKILLATALLLSVSSCSSMLNPDGTVKGYKPELMQRSLQKQAEMNYNTRIFVGTGGRYYPGL